MDDTQKNSLFSVRTVLILGLAVFGLAGIGLCIVSFVSWNRRSPDDTVGVLAQVTHPVLQTPVTSRSSSRPAVQVDILDAAESWLGDAELYLAVQSSRSPEHNWVLLPINVGGFQGCRTRFIQLPFEVTHGDTLLFNLLDDDELSNDEERRIMSACKVGGFCLWCAGSIDAPELRRFISPTATMSATEVLGDAVVSDVRRSKFDNYGQAEFIVQPEFPSAPAQANKLTILDDKKFARIQLRFYAPKEELPVELAAR